MNNIVLYAGKDDITVTYGNRDYRIQDDRGYRHIVVRLNGIRTKITVKERKWDLVQWYVLDGLFQEFPCIVMSWWVKMRIENKYINFKKYCV